MLNLRKNIWLLFAIILVVGSAILLVSAYEKYASMKQAHYREIGAMNSLVARSFHSELVESELLLNILGRRLLDGGRYRNEESVQKLFAELLSIKPALRGFGLLDADGNYLITSSNIDLAVAPNLLQQPESRDTFEYTLQSRQVTLGRTYFFKPLQEWVIPLRKALRDETGQVVAVMATAVSVGKTGFMSEIRLDSPVEIQFINNKNLYRVYRSGTAPAEYAATYLYPVDDHVKNTLGRVLAKRAAKARQSGPLEEPVFVDSLVGRTGDAALASIVYNPFYDTFSITTLRAEVFNRQYLEAVARDFLVFVSFMAVIFWLTKIIAKHDEGVRKHYAFLANHDPLTGLFNRNYLHETLGKNNAGEAFSVLFVDLDNFKNINDNFGHHVGDQLLLQVADRLRRIILASDLVIRFGGDEFVVIVRGRLDQDFDIARNIIDTVSKTYYLSKNQFNIGASIGIARYPQDSDNLDSLLSMADMAMYRAKRRKNWVERYTPEIWQQAERRVLIENALRKALEKQEFSMVYQPQFTHDRHIHGVEALVRWRNQELGMVPPDEFIPIAEDIGIITEIGRYILDTALSEMVELQRGLATTFTVSINISVKQLADASFYDDCMASIARSGLEMKQVALEVTESMFIEDLDAMLPLLTRIRERGVAIAMDDFGKGYSSLSLLRQLPISELKIDKQFVDDLTHDQQGKGLVENIIAIAQKLGMRTVAEGVETAEQFRILLESGCDTYQGYFFSRPLPKDQLMLFLQRT